jgi:hypothetical protein
MFIASFKVAAFLLQERYCNKNNFRIQQGFIGLPMKE